MSVLNDFISYLEEQVKNHSIYVWGSQGQSDPTITEAWIKSRESSTANANRAIAFWRKQVLAGYGSVLRAFDCSGLGIYWLYNLKKIFKSDMTANTMMSKCKKIKRTELMRGDWVFRVSSGKAYHIGYVVDDNLNVIEAKGRDDGVVKKSLNGNGTTYWNEYGRPDIFADEINGSITSTTPPAPSSWKVSRVLKLVSPMLRGDDVKELQKRLKEMGYDVGAIDGILGSKTETAIKAFQKAKGLTVDGKAGKDTITALGGVWNG